MPSWKMKKEAISQTFGRIASVTRHYRWDEEELTRRRKDTRHKVSPARRRRAETMMSLAWIARRPQMGS
jgi:hypothetical protein